MKKIVTMLLAVILAVGCLTGLTACGDVDTTGFLPVCIASEPDTIDPALNSSVDGATLCIHLNAGLVKYNAQGALVADCAKQLPTATENQDGSVTYLFELKDGLKWSNGEALKASDFEWSWKRAASTELGADYGYMFDVIKGYGEDDVDALAPLAVVADDTANTLAVTLNVDVPYFFELCAFPAYMPVYKAEVEKNPDGWATSPKTYITNGAYTIAQWKHNEKIVLKKNVNYYDAASIKQEGIVFYLSDDAASMLANFKNGDWMMIDDVPTEEIANLKTQYASEYFVGSQLGTYYINFNINLDLLPEGYVVPTDAITAYGSEANAKVAINNQVKSVLGLLLDRDYICVNIGQAGQEPASSFVALGLTDASNNGEQFYLNANNDGANMYDPLAEKDYAGYYNAAKSANEANATIAVDFLKTIYNYDATTKKFTNFPGFTYLYNTNAGHQKIGEYVQGALGAYGISVNLVNQEWNTFLNTRKEGDYGVSRNGWLGDYNDPISFIDMWTTASGNNDVQYGKAPTSSQLTDGLSGMKFIDASQATIYSINLSAIDAEKYADAKYNKQNGTWAETFDVLVAAIKTETDQVKRFKMLHLAEDLFMQSGNICPLYYYTDIYMLDDSVEGFFASPLGYKYFMYCTISAD